MKSQNKTLKSVLSIALIATFLTDEVIWSVGDFVFAWILIFSASLTYRLASERMSESISFRIAVGVTVFATLALIWSNLAVGIIGSEDNSYNLWYFGVVIIIATGSLIARFKPHKMGMVLLVAALTQSLITLASFLIGMPQITESSISEILMINGFFIILLLISAGLFRQAANEQNNSKIETTI